MAQRPEIIGREVLPIPDIPVQGKMALDARDAEFPAIKPLRPPQGAPNVAVVLLDDMGFGAPSVTGGPCYMPAMQRVADDGLLYNRFHTTALCSPTRVALLTGRNHHSAGIGSVAEVATGAGAEGVAVTPDGGSALVGTEEGSLSRWDLRTGKLIAKLAQKDMPVSSIALCSDGNQALVVTYGEPVEIPRRLDEKELDSWAEVMGRRMNELQDLAQRVALVVAITGRRQGLRPRARRDRRSQQHEQIRFFHPGLPRRR